MVLYFYISNSNCLLLVYRKIIDFLLSTLHPSTLLQLHISSGRLFWFCFLIFCQFFRTFCIYNHVIYEKRHFNIFLHWQYIFSLLFFSCITTLARNSSIRLNRNSKKKHIFLAPKGRAFGFLVLCIAFL